jgi:hypothetical protein
MARIILGEAKRGRLKKSQKTHNLKGPKKGRKLVFLVVGSYFTHGPFNVTYMQIVGFNSSGRFKTNITCQCNILLYGKG